MTWLAVALGSALGGLARMLCSSLAHALLGAGFPFGTLAVNVLGSFLIGLYAALTAPEGRLLAGSAQRQLVMAGFCGGFTTFSIFSLETMWLWQAAGPGLAAFSVLLSLALWLLAVFAGFALGVRLNRLPGAAS